MAISCRSAIAGLVAVTVGIGFSTAAIAQDFPLVSGVPFGQLPQKFDNAFFQRSPNFYGSQTLGGQLKFLLGAPENSIARDGKAVNELYREVLYKQINAGPIIRTLDLPSPFPYSVRNLPASVVVMPNESAPPPVVIFPEAAPQPLPQAMPQKPVPGLW
ncbi:MAG: hypothetical protein DCF22_08965 [Leptolyngbya sp.]|nr:MAG: hypothetical protein DCF22_08965 [Leptolyngbya sp.]